MWVLELAAGERASAKLGEQTTLIHKTQSDRIHMYKSYSRVSFHPIDSTSSKYMFLHHLIISHGDGLYNKHSDDLYDRAPEGYVWTTKPLYH